MSGVPPAGLGGASGAKNALLDAEAELRAAVARLAEAYGRTAGAVDLTYCVVDGEAP